MQNIITIKVLSAVSENGFSLDELVFKTRELFAEKGLPGFVGLILRLTDEVVCRKMVQGKSKRDRPACCSNPRYEYQGSLDRQFRTSVGTVAIQWRRLRCCNCGRTNIPLRDFLGIDHYQSKTPELEKMVAEIVSEQSYRRSSSHLSTIGSIPVPKSTAHRWLLKVNVIKLMIAVKPLICFLLMEPVTKEGLIKKPILIIAANCGLP
jgi:hypothetical protein